MNLVRMAECHLGLRTRRVQRQHGVDVAAAATGEQLLLQKLLIREWIKGKFY